MKDRQTRSSKPASMTTRELTTPLPAAARGNARRRPKLTPICRLAFARMRPLSYGDAAKELGIERVTVKPHVVRAQRMMRMELRAMRMVVPDEKKAGKRKARQRWRRKPSV